MTEHMYINGFNLIQIKAPFSIYLFFIYIYIFV